MKRIIEWQLGRYLPRASVWGLQRGVQPRWKVSGFCWSVRDSQTLEFKFRRPAATRLQGRAWLSEEQT